MSRQHARFDPTALGAGLVLERSSTVLTYDSALSINRTARSTEPKTRGRWTAEWLVWGDASIANAVSLGLVRVDASLATYVGGDVYGYGYRPAEGQIHHNGSSIETVDTCGKNQYIGILFDANELTATWAIDGDPIVTIELDAGAYALGATISGATGFDLRILQNTGQRGIERPFPATRGWLARRESQGVIRIADKPFITSGTDPQPNTAYRGLLRDDSRLQLSGALEFWPMRGASSAIGAASGTLVLANADGSLDRFITSDMVDARVRFLQIPDGGGYSDAVPVADLVVVDADAESDEAINVDLGDPLAELEQSLQTRMYGPHVEPTSADRVYPVTIGVARSVEPGLLTWSGFPPPAGQAAMYALHDGPVLGLGGVLDGGYPLDPAADPPDYYLDAEGRLVLQADPFYRLTADVSSVGGGAPGGLVDLYDGAGDFSSATGWTVEEGLITGGVLILNDSVTSNSGRVESWAAYDDLTLEADKIYRVEITVDSITGFFGGTGQHPRLVLTRSTISGTPNATYALWSRDEAGTYSATLAPRPYTSLLYIALVGTQSSADEARVSSIKCYEVFSDPVDDESLLPEKLEPMLRKLFEERAGWASSRWAPESAAAIDVASGFAGTGIHARDATNIRAELQPVLDSYCACLWRDRAGVVRVARFRRPTEGEAIGTITRAKMLGPIRPVRYLAPGLTNQAVGRKNHTPLTEGQMSTDTVDVSLAMRERLKAAYRITAASSVPLSQSYAHAVGAPPVAFALDKREDIQAALDYACEIHSADLPPLSYYLVSVPYDLSYERDQVWMVSYELRLPDGALQSRYGLGGAGKPMLILDVREDAIARTAELFVIG